MANARYPYSEYLFGTEGIDLLTDTIKVVLLDLTKYTYSAAHQFLSDLVGDNDPRIGTAQQITTPALDDTGVFSGNGVTFSALTGNTVGAMAIYKDTGTAATSPLIGYYDHDINGNPISITPNGTDLTVTWDTGANKILRV
jgi:hypothetical protein